ncbi:MAG: thiol oxidoreductase, partial [Bdellovibrionales bacterium]|nr:thiol oxidoreductase [Bdellovibrionales bacterium]
GQPTLEQQSAAAAFFDMGVTSSLFAESGTSQELSDLTLEQLAVYQALAGVPRARNQDLPEVIAGKAHFQSLGCADCHRMTFTTRNTEFSELDGQLVHPFTDLLLHDMGPGLADKHREFSATGSEWRTTPLWGIGFFASVSGVAQRYLHDGRARTIEEAILWHGGEAKSAQQRYLEASKSERDELLSFLNSL